MSRHLVPHDDEQQQLFRHPEILPDLVRDRSTPTTPGDYVRYQPVPTTNLKIIGAIGLAGGFLLALLFTGIGYYLDTIVLAWVGAAIGFMMMIGGLIAFIRADSIDKENKRQLEIDDSNMGHLKTLDTTRLGQRSKELEEVAGVVKEIIRGKTEIEKTRTRSDADKYISDNEREATIGAARYGAIGDDRRYEREKNRLEHESDLRYQEAKRIRDYEAKEAKKQRKFKATENQRDRELAIDRLITQAKNDLRELQIRMEYEKPDVVQRMQEQAYEAEARIRQLQRIQQFIDDPVMFHNLMEAFQRGR